MLKFDPRGISDVHELRNLLLPRRSRGLLARKANRHARKCDEQCDEGAKPKR